MPTEASLTQALDRVLLHDVGESEDRLHAEGVGDGDGGHALVRIVRERATDLLVGKALFLEPAQVDEPHHAALDAALDACARDGREALDLIDGQVPFMRPACDGLGERMLVHGGEAGGHRAREPFVEGGEVLHACDGGSPFVSVPVLSRPMLTSLRASSR